MMPRIEIARLVADAVGDSQLLAITTFVMSTNLMIRAGLIGHGDVLEEIINQQRANRNLCVAHRLEYLAGLYTLPSAPLLTVVRAGDEQ
jgi:hypothetical protein